MRFFRKRAHVCQNCIHSNNKKGKWKKTIFYSTGVYENGKKDKRHWNIFCEKKNKYFPWDRYKYCFEGEGDKKMSENIELTELETQMCIYKVEITWRGFNKTHIKMPGDNYPKFMQMTYDKFPEITRVKVIETEMIN